MKKIRQCIYTVILIVTCFVASPFIFKQIWDSSAEKKKTEKLPPITLNLPTQASQESTQPAEQPSSENSAAVPAQTTAPTGSQPVTEAAEPSTEAATEASSGNGNAVYVQSDPSYFDDALFIGDSRTVGLMEYGTLKNADYFCDVGLASYKIDSEYIDGYSFIGKLTSKQYGKIYIMLGINEVGNDFNYTVNAYSSMIETIKANQPDAIIYIIANLHVTSAAETSSISNDRINYLNASLSQFADYKKIFYIDINPVFDDPNGALRSDATGDGVHVYGDYYKLWCEWLCMNTVQKYVQQ